MLDRQLNFADHALKVKLQLMKDYQRLCRIAPFVHPRYALMVWQSSASTALYGCEMWLSSMSSASWTMLETAYARGDSHRLRIGTTPCGSHA